MDALVTMWNRKSELVFGWSKAEAIGLHISALYPPQEILEGLPARDLAAVRVLRTDEQESWRVRKDGTEFLASITMTAVCDARGLMIGYETIIRDITDRTAKERLEPLLRSPLSIVPDGTITIGRLLPLPDRQRNDGNIAPDLQEDSRIALSAVVTGRSRDGTIFVMDAPAPEVGMTRHAALTGLICSKIADSDGSPPEILAAVIAAARHSREAGPGCEAATEVLARFFETFLDSKGPGNGLTFSIVRTIVAAHSGGTTVFLEPGNEPRGDDG